MVGFKSTCLFRTLKADSETVEGLPEPGFLFGIVKVLSFLLAEISLHTALYGRPIRLAIVLPESPVDAHAIILDFSSIENCLPTIVQKIIGVFQLSLIFENRSFRVQKIIGVFQLSLIFENRSFRVSAVTR